MKSGSVYSISQEALSLVRGQVPPADPGDQAGRRLGTRPAPGFEVDRASELAHDPAMERLHVEASVAQAKDLPSCVIGLPVASHDLLSMLIRSMTATVVGSVQIAIYHSGGRPPVGC